MAYSLFSFILRPIAVSLCDSFVSFYYFNVDSYNAGIIIANACILLFMVGYVLALKAKRHVVEVDLDQLKRIAWHVSLYAIFVMFAAIMIYGNVILPGFRSTGLSKAAPGSQIFFAVFSILIVPAISLRILMMAPKRINLKKRIRSLLMLAALMAISMLFYQRGPAIQGVGLGLYLLVLTTPKADHRRLLKVFVVLFFLAGLVVFTGRFAVSAVVTAIYGANASVAVFGHVERSSSCKIAMMGSQEHDQVWPAVIDYVDSNGPDKYNNLMAAVMRPFLSSEQRFQYDLNTSVDTLNIFNNADVYLEKNFGFSITVWQYHYFAIGIFVIPLSMVLGFISARLENKIERIPELNLRSFVYMFAILQAIILINSAIDERLKWVIMTLVVIYALSVTQRMVFLRR